MILGLISPLFSFFHVMLTIADGGVILQLAVLFLLKELLLVIVEVEVAEDNKVQSSADSPLMRWSQIDDGFRLCHYFDYICGMSYGGYVQTTWTHVFE